LGARSSTTGEATIVMKPQPDPSTLEVLAGLVERITYHNEENGFCVLRIKARGHRELVTVRLGQSRRSSGKSWSSCTATVSAQRGRCASTRPTARTPCRSCRRTHIGSRATSAALASHSEQSWVVRYSETSSVLPPFLMDLYESMRLKSDHPASSTLFAMVV
jgi:hypothetical protein